MASPTATPPQPLLEVHGAFGPSGEREDVPMDVQKNFGFAVMTIAGADGEFSDAERDYFLGLSQSFGATADIMEEYRSFDPLNKRLEDYLSPEYRSMAPHFIYDAIRVAGVDDLNDQERQALHHSAKILGVDSWTVEALISLVEAEKALREMRLSLFKPHKAS